jgi:hypothetical protein
MGFLIKDMKIGQSAIFETAHGEIEVSMADLRLLHIRCPDEVIVRDSFERQDQILQGKEKRDKSKQLKREKRLIQKMYGNDDFYC